VFSSYLEFRTMDKVHKPSDSQAEICRQADIISPTRGSVYAHHTMYAQKKIEG
jgi:hypothetical protein